VDKVLLGAGKVAHGEMSPLYSYWYWEPTGDEKRDFNPDKAKQLLEAAGYKAGADGMRTGPDGKALSLRMFARSDNTDSQDEARYIQEWLKDVGIKVDVQVMSEDALTDVIGKGKYDITIQDLDGPRTYQGAAAGPQIQFDRNGVKESIRRTDGAATGMKWRGERASSRLATCSLTSEDDPGQAHGLVCLRSRIAATSGRISESSSTRNPTAMRAGRRTVT